MANPATITERHPLHLVFVEAWAAVKDYFDLALRDCYETCCRRASSGTLYKHKEMCAVFMAGDIGAFNRVLDAVRDQQDPAPVDLRFVLRSSSCLSVVVSCLALKMDFADCINRVRRSLKDLEHNNFEVQEVENLKCIMQTSADRLVEAGVRSFDKQLRRSSSWIARCRSAFRLRSTN